MILMASFYSIYASINLQMLVSNNFFMKGIQLLNNLYNIQRCDNFQKWVQIFGYFQTYFSNRICIFPIASIFHNTVFVQLLIILFSTIRNVIFIMETVHNNKFGPSVAVELQSHLVDSWSQNCIPEFYETLFLQFVKKLPADEAQITIQQQIRSMRKSNSYIQLFLKTMRDKTKIQEYLTPTHEAQLEFTKLCQGIGKLRELNFKAAYFLYKIRCKYESTSRSSSERYFFHRFAIRLDQFRKSMLKSKISRVVSWNSEYDPFFMALKSQGKTTADQSQALEDLFSLPVDDSYRFLKMRKVLISWIYLNQEHKEKRPGSSVLEEKYISFPSIKKELIKERSADLQKLKTIPKYQDDLVRRSQSHIESGANNSDKDANKTRFFRFSPAKDSIKQNNRNQPLLLSRSIQDNHLNSMATTPFQLPIRRDPGSGEIGKIKRSRIAQLSNNILSKGNRPRYFLSQEKTIQHRAKLDRMETIVYSPQIEAMSPNRNIGSNQRSLSSNPSRNLSKNLLINIMISPIRPLPKQEAIYQTQRNDVASSNVTEKPTQPRRFDPSRQNQELNITANLEKKPKVENSPIQVTQAKPQQDLKNEAISRGNNNGQKIGNSGNILQSNQESNKQEKQPYKIRQPIPQNKKQPKQLSYNSNIKQSILEKKIQQKQSNNIKQSIPYQIEQKYLNSNSNNIIVGEKVNPQPSPSYNIPPRPSTLISSTNQVTQPPPSSIQKPVIDKTSSQQPTNSYSPPPFLNNIPPKKQQSSNPSSQQINTSSPPPSNSYPPKKIESQIPSSPIVVLNPNQSIINSSVALTSKQEKRQIKIKVGKMTFVNFVDYLASYTSHPQFANAYDIKKILKETEVQQSYITQFLINNQPGALALSSLVPPMNNFAIRLWLIHSSADPTLSPILFKKYIQFVEKTITSSTIYFKGEEIQQLEVTGFQLKKQKLYARQRTTKPRQIDRQFEPFLYCECSHINFPQKQKEDILFSQQIQKFDNKNALSTEFLFSMENIPVPLVKLVKINKELNDFIQVNKILDSEDMDLYEVNKSITATPINLLRTSFQSLTKDPFTACEGIFKFFGFEVIASPQQSLYFVNLSRNNGKMYFGRGFEGIEQFRTNLVGDSSKRNCFCIPMFTKNIYGRYQKIRQNERGFYGNWEFSLVWEDEMQGRLKHSAENIASFTCPFMVGIEMEGNFLYAFQVRKDDLLY